MTGAPDRRKMGQLADFYEQGQGQSDVFYVLAEI